MILNRGEIVEAAKKCLVRAGTSFRVDQITAYRRAIRKETNKNAKWALEKILENAKIAEKNAIPLCDDTGIPHAFVEIGNEMVLPKDWLPAISDGVAQGLRIMPGRPMAVKGGPVERIEQSKGLFNDPSKLLLAPVIVMPVAGDKFTITVLLLGGGPEIRAKTYRVFHKRSIDVVLDEVRRWITSEVKNLGCTPCVPAIGIGRTHMEASALMLEAMKEGNLNRQNRWERELTEEINSTNVGPLGLRGDTTALGTFIKVGPLRASGVRIVCVRPCCCFEPRKATVVLGEKG
jgi:fumarate hydratase subunit alpha